MNFYPFHVGDYIKATAHLSPIEDIVYRRLLDLYFDTEEPIPNETQRVSRRLRLAGEEEVVRLILEEFFILCDDNLYHHNRCDDEIARYQAKAKIARVNGSKGGRPKKAKRTQRVNSANPTKSESKTNQNHNQNQTKEIKEKKAVISFDVFYLNYPKKTTKAEAIAYWKKMNDDDRLLAIDGIPNHTAGKEKRFIKDPVRYLKNKRWEDEINNEQAHQQSNVSPQQQLEQSITDTAAYIKSL